MNKIITITNGVYTKNIIDKIVSCLCNEEIIIMPSDTIYGFLALSNKEKQLREIKKRDEKPFLYLIHNINQLTFMGITINNITSSILSKYWPGSVTFILSSVDGKTYGVRMPEWNVLYSILKKVDKPLLSTSVNLSGEPAINNINNIINQFRDNVSLIINDVKFKPKEASTIVDLTKNPYQIIRQGSVVINA